MNFWLFFQSQIAFKSSTPMLRVMGIRTMTYTTSTWHFVMAEEAKILRLLIRSNTMYNTLKAHTKDAHTVCGRPTLKDVRRRNRSANFIRDILVSELIENHATSKLSRYIYERTFISEIIENHVTSNLPRGRYERTCEPIENHAISAMVSNFVIAEEAKILRLLIRSNTMYNTLKAHTKDAHTVCGRPTLKDVRRRNRSANFIRDILVSELIENHATSKLSKYIYE